MNPHSVIAWRLDGPQYWCLRRPPPDSIDERAREKQPPHPQRAASKARDEAGLRMGWPGRPSIYRRPTRSIHTAADDRPRLLTPQHVYCTVTRSVKRAWGLYLLQVLADGSRCPRGHPHEAAPLDAGDPQPHHARQPQQQQRLHRCEHRPPPPPTRRPSLPTRPPGSTEALYGSGREEQGVQPSCLGRYMSKPDGYGSVACGQEFFTHRDGWGSARFRIWSIWLKAGSPLPRLGSRKSALRLVASTHRRDEGSPGGEGNNYWPKPPCCMPPFAPPQVVFDDRKRRPACGGVCRAGVHGSGLGAAWKGWWLIPAYTLGLPVARGSSSAVFAYSIAGGNCLLGCAQRNPL
jgi:hypothetical protein